MGKMKSTCVLCAGSGWVCEEHLDLPWDHDEECDGVGVPCVCNRQANQPFVEVFVDYDNLETPLEAKRRDQRRLQRGL